MFAKPLVGGLDSLLCGLDEPAPFLSTAQKFEENYEKIRALHLA